MLSEGNQEDWVEHRRNLEAAKIALEMARIDPNFWGQVRQDRVNFYQAEVDKWKEICRI